MMLVSGVSGLVKYCCHGNVTVTEQRGEEDSGAFDKNVTEMRLKEGALAYGEMTCEYLRHGP